MKKGKYAEQLMLKQLNMYMVLKKKKEKKYKPSFKPFTKINLMRITDLNLKAKIIKLLDMAL